MGLWHLLLLRYFSLTNQPDYPSETDSPSRLGSFLFFMKITLTPGGSFSFNEVLALNLLNLKLQGNFPGTLSGTVLPQGGHVVSSVVSLYLHLPDFVSLCSPEWAEVTLGCCFSSSHSPHYTRGSCGPLMGTQHTYKKTAPIAAGVVAHTSLGR